MPTRERQIGLLGEAEDGEGRTAVVEQAEVFALEAGDEAALLVGDGEDEIDFVDLDFDGLGGLIGIGRTCRAVAGRHAGGRLRWRAGRGVAVWAAGGCVAVAAGVCAVGVFGALV